MSIKKLPKPLTVFALAMINVAAIGSIKNWPSTAEYGFSSLFFFVAAALIFFIPASLVSAELATGWPKIGGVYAWVKEAFGHKTAFLAIWMMWVNNVFFFPTLLSFIVSTVAYIFDPSLSNNPLYNTVLIFILFWGATFANFRGMRTSSLISSVSVIFGTFLPGLLIILLGCIWYFSDKPLQISLTLHELIPDLTKPEKLVFFAGIIFSLMGIEMSAVHARDVRHPQRDFPRAIALSGALILGLSIFGVLAIAIAVPQKEINLAAGGIQAFSYFVKAYGLSSLTPYMAALIVVGAFGSLSTWIAGPSKGLLAAAQGGDLPPFFRRVNSHGMPVVLLITQAVIVSLLSLMFLFMPTVNSAYWILVVLTTQLYLVMYILMFAAAIKLRYKKPDVERPYKIPGGLAGMWSVAGLGLITSILTLIIGFFPPSQIQTGNVTFYVSFLIIGMIVLCLFPYIILYFKKPSWSKPLAHERE